MIVAATKRRKQKKVEKHWSRSNKTSKIGILQTPILIMGKTIDLYMNNNKSTRNLKHK